MEALNVQSLRLLKLFGNTTSKKVTPSVGPEQEYFLVDAEKFLQRKDLIQEKGVLKKQLRKAKFL